MIAIVLGECTVLASLAEGVHSFPEQTKEDIGKDVLRVWAVKWIFEVRVKKPLSYGIDTGVPWGVLGEGRGSETRSNVFLRSVGLKIFVLS